MTHSHKANIRGGKYLSRNRICKESIPRNWFRQSM